MQTVILRIAGSEEFNIERRGTACGLQLQLQATIQFLYTIWKDLMQASAAQGQTSAP